MAVTKKNITGAFYFTYPSSDVFLKERNYFIFEGVQDDTYIKTVKIGNKMLNFGRYALDIGAKFYLDVSAYYAKYYGKFNVVITYENYAGDDVTDTTAINATTYDCYDPYKEVIQTICEDKLTFYSVITPPFRMLFLYPKNPYSMEIHSVFVGRVDNGDFWRINGVDYESKITIKDVHFTQPNLIIERIRKTNGATISKIERTADLLDQSIDFVQVKWRTRWGVDVSHIFYLNTYATDKEDAQEVESEYLYEEYSKHIIKGSFYLNNIRNSYDLWYYQTLMNSELVNLRYFQWASYEAIYMPNATTTYNNVKITGCNIKDAVVDGVAQSTITFDFELR